MADYDVVFVGAGPGGYVGAIRAAQLGGKVAVVENRQLGGVCLNRGCIPTKMYLHTADLLHEGTHASEYGLNFGKPSIDFPKLNQKRDSIVSTLRKGVAGLFKKNKVEHIQGTAAIEAPGKVRIDTEEGDKTISASNIVIATGSEPDRPSVFPFDGKRILTSDEILQLNEIPKSLIIVGGGYIGCEYACFFNRMGTSVTIVEMLDQLLPMMDADIASELSKTFQKAGIKIHTSAKAENMKAGSKGVSCTVDGNEMKADLAMIAVGRKLNSDIAGVKELGIELDKNAIVVDDRCQTNVDGIYAIGDVTGKYMLAHVASHMGMVAAENIMGHPRRMDYRVVPAVFFTRPQISSVGMTEKEATAAQIDYKVSKFSFRGLGMAQVLNSPNGYVKIIGNTKTGEILGCQIIGVHATELIEEMAVAIKLQATVEEITHTIHPHPTLSESMLEACESWLGLGINS